MERVEEEGSSDSQDSNGDDGFERRGILGYDRVNVRNLNLNEVVSRMNQLRQNPSTLERAECSRTSRAPSGSSTTTPSIDTSRSPTSSQAGSSSSTPRSGRGNLSPRVTFYPEFKKKAASLEPLNLDRIPAACARSEPVTPRRGDLYMNPFRIHFYGYQSGDAVSSPRIRLPPVISPIRCPRGNPRLLPRNPLGLVYGSQSRSYATREFFASEFGRRNSRERLSSTGEESNSGQFQEKQHGQSNEQKKNENKEDATKSESVESGKGDPYEKSCTSGSTKEPSKSENEESGERDSQEESFESGNKEDPEA